VETTARFKRSNGDYLWIYTRKMVYQRDADNKPSVIITVAENITEMVDILEQLKEKTSRLKLISWKNSHELRAPVANIIALLDLIEEEHIVNTHNLEVFTYLKATIAKLDRVILEMNDTINS
jgi:signal transduction histidine kinase